MTLQRSFDTTLRCVALPIVASDIGKALEELLVLWADPRFAPVLNNSTVRPHLLIVVNNAPDADLEEARALYEAQPELASNFAGVTVRSADLHGDMDRYERKPRERVGTFGARAGPNFQFFKTMEMAAAFGGFTLQIELDCLPVQAGWVEATQRVIDGHASAWVIGSVYAGSGELKRDSQTHLNGNALYRTGDPLFQSFAAEVWLPRLLLRIKEDYTLPYDCWWALERSKASALEANEAWHLFQVFDSFMHSDPFIVNLLCKSTDSESYFKVFDTFCRLGQTPVFFHGAAMNRLRRILIDHPTDTIRQSMDRLTGQRGSHHGAIDFKVKQRGIAPGGQDDQFQGLPFGEALLSAATAQLLAYPGQVGTMPPDVLRSREIVGNASPIARQFDRALAFARRSGGP